MKMKRKTLLKAVVFLVSVSSIASKKIDLAFLLDSWPRLDEWKTDGEFLKEFIRDIYGSFPIGDNALHVGLIKSGATAKIVFDFNSFKDLESLDEAVDDLTLRKHPSNIGKALNLANYGLFKNSGRPDAVKVLMLITKNRSSDDMSGAARDLRNSGVNIVSVGIGQSIYRDDLQSIVSQPKQYNSIFSDFQSLKKLVPDLVKRIKTIAETTNLSTPQRITQTKETDEDDKCPKNCEKQVKGETIPINCNNCKLAGCCDMCCNDAYKRKVYAGPVELAFLLDESGELKNWNNFERIKSVMKNLTRQFDFSNKKTKFGIISFSRDNVQIYNLRSYHERVKIDNQIDKLNYEGIQGSPGPLNKGLDATQTNLFSEPRDLSVPRVLLVFDSATEKDEQTEVKAFKLRSSDVQTFCIGLGASYDKKECDKLVEKPSEKHSLAAQVSQLSELQEPITRMIVNDIANKYCPLCGQGGADACRPCKAARQYTGKDEDVPDMKPTDILTIMKTFGQGNDQNMHMKSAPKLQSLGEENDVKGTKALAASGLQNQGSAQVGTPFPNADLVKDLLQSGTVLDSNESPKVPFLADNPQGLLQQNPIIQQQPIQQQNLATGIFPQLDGALGNTNQNSLLQAISTAANSNPSQLSFLSNANENVGATPGPRPLSFQPVVVDPSLLNQAVLGNGKDETRKHLKMDGPKLESPELPMSALPTLPVNGADKSFSNDLSSFQAGPLNPGVTSSMPLLPVPFRHQTDVEDSVPPQFQSLLPKAMRLPFLGRMRIPQRNKALFEDEYKYDLFDKEGPFVMPCKDLSDDCEFYATEGGCDEWAPLSPIGEVKTMCKKSCGLCNTKMGKAHKKSLFKPRKETRKKARKH